MTCVIPAHGQRSVHVNVVTREVQGDQALEDDRPPWKRTGEKDEQTRCRTPIRDHVQYRSEGRALIVPSRCEAVQRVQ